MNLFNAKRMTSKRVDLYIKMEKLRYWVYAKKWLMQYFFF